MNKIAKLKKKFNSLKSQLAEVGYIIQGSIGEVRYKCGRKTCKCASDPSERHGPYYVLTSKENKKTVSCRVKKEKIDLCKKFIENNDRLKSILKELRKISVEYLKELDLWG